MCMASNVVTANNEAESGLKKDSLLTWIAWGVFLVAIPFIVVIGIIYCFFTRAK